MKKNLVALAVLAASGASFAQSSVTLYGLLDVWGGRVDDGTSKQTSIGSGGVDDSRWGIKGSEDLGGGLKAIFQLEQGFDLDTGASGTTTNDLNPQLNGTQTFDRTAYVGLSGDFGEFQIGKVWSAYDDVIGSSNALFDANIAPIYTAFISGQNYNDRPINGFRYTSPEISGFTGTASHSLDEKNPAASAVTAASISFAGGPIGVQLGYQVENPKAAATPSVKYTLVGASYDFGSAVAKVIYSDVKDGINNQGLTVDAAEYQLGLDVPVGENILLSASYARSDDDKSTVKRDAYAVGATYTLSKRTYLYSAYRLGSETLQADTRLFAVGINHNF